LLKNPASSKVTCKPETHITGMSLRYTVAALSDGKVCSYNPRQRKQKRGERGARGREAGRKGGREREREKNTRKRTYSCLQTHMLLCKACTVCE